MKIRITAFLLAMLFLLGGCSFKNMISDDLLITVQNRDPVQTSGYTYTDVTELQLPIGEDTLNPYKMTIDTNLRLVPLLYDGLTRIGQDYNYERALAYEIENNGYVCDVTLKDGIVFSDGTPVTAQDVQYSYRQAVYWGETEYSHLFENVGGVSVLNDKKLRFYLMEPDVMFPNMLCFPVIKSGTANAPIGCGRFYLAKENVLKPNRSWYGGVVEKINKIVLVEQPDRETSFYSMKTGNLDYLFIDTDEEITDGGGSVQYVDMPNLLYIGVNDNVYRLSDSRFRRLLEAAINREKLLESVYYDRALPTDLPFPQKWEELRSRQADYGGDFALVQALLSELGLDNRDEEGYIIVGSRRVSLDLLVNGDNPTKVKLAEGIRDMLNDIGFDITVEAVDFATYQQCLLEGNYELYLGEVRLDYDLDLRALFRTLHYYGTEENLLTADTYDQWKNGYVELDVFLQQFEASMPFIPLGTRSGVIYYNRDIYYELRATVQDIFYNIQNW